jgi:O-antigen ligase
LNDRLNIWIAGWHAFARAPWCGHGAGTYAFASGLSEGDTAHNTLMAILVTGGVVGAALFVACILSVIWSVGRTTGLLRIALITTLIVWAITATVGSVEENRATWLLLGLMAVAGRLAEYPAMAALFSGEARRSQAFAKQLAPLSPARTS